MAKEKHATWWKMFAHQRAAIDCVSDEDAGRGLKAAFRYFDGEDVPDNLPQGAYVVFCTIRPYIDEAKSDYEKRVNDGKRGAEAKRNKQAPLSPPKPPLVLPREEEAEAEVYITEDTNVSSRPNSADAEPDAVKKGGSGKRSHRIYDHDSMPYKAAAYLAERRAENVPQMKPPTETHLQSWADSFRLLHDRDGYAWELIQDVLNYAVDDPFWRRNILSGDKFRKQFETLLAKTSTEATI